MWPVGMRRALQSTERYHGNGEMTANNKQPKFA